MTTMGDKGARVFVRGGFSPGTKVGITGRFADFAPKRLVADQTQTVGDDTTVTFTGLEEGARYWVFDIDDDTRRVLAATAKTEPAPRRKLTDAKVKERLAQTVAPRRSEFGQVVTDPETRTTSVVLAAGGLPMQGNTGKPTKDGEQEAEPQPRLRQEDARNVPQRSATLTGSAHPVDPGEPQPKLAQQDLPSRNVPQRSATELGEATPIPADDVSPAMPQEDARDLDQRSATETGAAVLKPLGDQIEQAKARDASVTQAVGEADPAPKQSDSASHRRQSAARQVSKTVKRDITEEKK